MTIAVAATTIRKRFSTGTAHRFDVELYTDDRLKARDGTITSGDDVRAFVADPSGSVSSYACSVTSYSLGQFYFLLTAGNHATAGDALCDMKVNRIPVGSFAWEFFAKLA